jgi:hypothetical protein
MKRTELAKFRIRIEIITAHANNCAFRFTSIYPLRHHDGDIHLDSLFPQGAAALRADEVGSINANGIDQFAAYAVQRNA